MKKSFRENFAFWSDDVAAALGIKSFEKLHVIFVDTRDYVRL